MVVENNWEPLLRQSSGDPKMMKTLFLFMVALGFVGRLLERALAGPLTGAETMWSMKGDPAALHCR